MKTRSVHTYGLMGGVFFALLLSLPASTSIGAQEGPAEGFDWFGSARSNQYEVRIESNVREAEVTVDGEEQEGSLPMRVYLQEGNHRFTVSKDGFIAFDRTMRIERDTTIDASLEREGSRERHRLRVIADVVAARVYIDGERQPGTAPVVATLEPGTYRVAVEAPGHPTWRRTIELDRDREIAAIVGNPARADRGRGDDRGRDDDRERDDDRDRDDGARDDRGRGDDMRRSHRLSVEANVDGAAIYVDGRRRGTGNVRLRLRPGRHSIRVSAEGYLDFRTTLNLHSNETVRVPLEPSEATVRIELAEQFRNPSLSREEIVEELEIYLDDERKRGLSFEVEPGRHQLRLSSGAFTLEKRIMVAPGDTRTVRPEFGLSRE